MTYVSAIVVAAGMGMRFCSRTPKPLVKIDSRPLVFYCLKTLSRHPLVSDIVLVVNAKILSRITATIKKYRIKKVTRVVIGGRRRQDSVYNGIKAVGERAKLVLIHDGARPFVGKEAITAAVREAADSGAAVVGVPVKATVKKVVRLSRSPRARYTVRQTLKRDELWEIQTPQVFAKDLILRAYKRFGSSNVTDDAALVEKLGAEVKVVQGTYFNIKITTPEDLVIARSILRMHAV